MLVNILRVAFRTLLRNRGFAILNVVGLSFGVACVILIALYIQDERAFDDFNERAERVVRLDLDVVNNGVVEGGDRTPGILGPTLASSMPEVVATVRLTNADPVLRANDRPFEAENLLLADPDVFDVFTLPFLEGAPSMALAEPGSIVLTETLATTLFGDTPAMGQTLGWKDGPLTVTGVMRDVPRQSHLDFDGLISLESVRDPGWYYGNWFATAFATYAVLREGTDLEAFEARLPAFIEDVAAEAMADEGVGLAARATPLPDLYLTATQGLGEFGNETTLGILALVALFVLLIAAVNFTNLATARSMDRAREVGVRKTLGAERGSLVAQFLAEALVLSAIATVLAVVLTQLSLPAFREVSGKPLSLVDLGAGWGWILGLVAVTGLLAGAYPAFVLSGFNPVQVLKGRFASGTQGQALRQGLVVVQFSISVALIAATVIVFSQLRHMQSQDLGIDLGGETSQLVVVPFMGDSSVVARLAPMRSRLRDIPGVDGVTTSISAPTYGAYSGGGFIETPTGELSQEISADMVLTDTSFVSVYGVTMLAGRRPNGLADGAPLESPREYALSESAIRAAGYTSAQEALGKPAAFWGIEGQVVGVVADVHAEGLQSQVRPMVILPDAAGDIIPPNVFTLRVRTAGLPATLSQIETFWVDAVPSRPFDYAFLDEDFANQYIEEQRFGRLFGLFAGLAIAIACLGLFGLAAHAAASRTKEIGVRRVLGATVAQVVVLLTRNVVALVAVGVAIAVPVVLIGMSRWLDTFAYRIEVGWMPLALAGGLVLMIAVATVGGHALRAAGADPVNALRSE